jgi:amidase
MTVKESFDVAGLPTTWGFTEQRDNIATEDALAVARFKRAGAVVFGKTNVPVALGDWQSYNPIYGATSNPWNLEHTPGGSSGGSSAALAAGLTGLEIGSDIGGSIRVPAAFAGVFGHKPTWNLIPMRGHSLMKSAAPTDISAIGPLARSASDLDLALDLLARPDPLETGLAYQLPAPRTRGLRGLRLALWTHQPGQHTDPEVSAALRTLGRALERDGANIDVAARPDFDPAEAFDVYLKLLYAALSGRATEAALAGTRAKVAKLTDADTGPDAVMIRGVDMPHRDWIKLNERRYQIRKAWSAFFAEYDALLCPVIGSPALPHRQDGETWDRTLVIDGKEVPYNSLLFWPGVTCAYHLPATAAPIARSKSGLPIGVQIVGPLYGDRTTIAIARALEHHGLKFTPPAGWE